MLPEIEPQACRGQFREHMWENPEYWAEQKFHGCRYLLYSDGRLLSRHASVKGTGFVDKMDRVPHLASVARILETGTALDGEIVLNDFGTVRDVTSILGSDPELAIYKQNSRGNLQFRVFDIPFIEKNDVRKCPLYERREMLEYLFQKKHMPSVSLVEKVQYHKEDFCGSIMERGGEGVILKHRNSLYGEKKHWIKVKRENTYDVFITGFKPADRYSKKVSGEVSETKYYLMGWIGAVEISMIDAITGEYVSVGTCSGFTEETRKFITENKELCLGKVIEITAQSQHETGKFEHGRFERWREDKHSTDCVLVPNHYYICRRKRGTNNESG